MKEKEKSGRKKCPSLEPGVRDTSFCVSLWKGGTISTGLNSATASNRGIQRHYWKQTQHLFYTFNEVKPCQDPKVRLF